jgi:hypothetical protein
MMRRHYDWVALAARLRARPSVWVLAFPNHPARLEKRIRLRQHPDLRFDDGVIEARIIHKHTPTDGTPHGDVWVRWVPTPTDEQERP